jgi:hypothetical protein
MKVLASLLSAGLLLACDTLADAGRFGGPGIDVSRAQAYASVWYTDTFEGGRLASVSIVGDGDTDLDLFVYDEHGTCVARGIGLSDCESVSFVPRFTGRFRIEVRNLGSVWNEFTLRTN